MPDARRYYTYLVYRLPKLDSAEIRKIAKAYGIDYVFLTDALPFIAEGIKRRNERSKEPDADDVEREIKAMRRAAATLHEKLSSQG